MKNYAKINNAVLKNREADRRMFDQKGTPKGTQQHISKSKYPWDASQMTK